MPLQAHYWRLRAALYHPLACRLTNYYFSGKISVASSQQTIHFRACAVPAASLSQLSWADHDSVISFGNVGVGLHFGRDLMAVKPLFRRRRFESGDAWRRCWAGRSSMPRQLAGVAVDDVIRARFMLFTPCAAAHALLDGD